MWRFALKTSSPSVHQRSSECEPQGRDCHGKQCYDCICLPLCDKGVAKTNLLTFLASLTKDQLQHFSSSHLWSQCLWTCSLPPQQWHSAGPSWVISEELKFTSNSLLVDQSKSGATLQPKGTFWWRFPLPSRFLAPPLPLQGLLLAMAMVFPISETRF